MYPSNPLKVPTFPEFEHLYWREFKRRQTKLKQERRLLVRIDYILKLVTATVFKSKELETHLPSGGQK